MRGAVKYVAQYLCEIGATILGEKIAMKEPAESIKEEEDSPKEKKEGKAPLNSGEKVQDCGVEENSGARNIKTDNADQSASVSLSELNISEIRDCLHIQQGESLILFPTLKAPLPFISFRLAVGTVIYNDLSAIPYIVHNC